MLSIAVKSFAETQFSQWCLSLVVPGFIDWRKSYQPFRRDLSSRHLPGHTSRMAGKMFTRQTPVASRSVVQILASRLTGEKTVGDIPATQKSQLLKPTWDPRCRSIHVFICAFENTDCPLNGGDDELLYLTECWIVHERVLPTMLVSLRIIIWKR